MPIFTAVWAMVVLPIWLLLVRVPAAFVAKDFWVPALIFGYVLGTWLVLRADHRVGPLQKKDPWWPQGGHQIILALIAGMGISILASELGNIGEDMAGRPTPLQDPVDFAGSPWVAAFLVGLIHPACFMVVLVGVAQRRLRILQRPRLTIGLIVLLGTLGVPLPLIAQGGLLVGFPAWLFAQTQRLGLAIAAYVPSGLLSASLVLGLEPGIPGFDLMDPDQRSFQPMWFNVVGAVLVAIGLAGLTREFEAHD